MVWLVLGWAAAGMEPDAARAWEFEWHGDRKAAAPLFVAACEASSPRACAWVAGWGESVSPERRAVLREAACRDGDALGCLLLGEWTRSSKGWPHGVPYFERARVRFAEECDDGDVRGCTWLGRIHADALGVDRDRARAATLWTQTCSLGDRWGCRLAGALGKQLVRVERPEAAPVPLLEVACGHDDLDACRVLAKVLLKGRLVPAAPERAAAVLEKGCGLRDARACVDLGILWEFGEGEVVTDRASAREAYDRACALGDGQGCQRRDVLAKP